MRPWIKPTLIGVGVVVIYVVGMSVGSRLRAKNAPAQASTAPRAAIAVVQRAQMSNSLSIAGEFVPYQEVDVHAKVTGYVKKIFVDIGDHVKEGQVLAVLEVPELHAQVEGAEAGVRHSQREILRAEEEVTRAEADHAALHEACRRLKEAAAARPGLVAQQEIDDAVGKDRASEAQVAAAKAALSAAREQLGISKATRSQVAAISDYSRISAPFTGIVTWRYADTGALVQAGTSNTNAQPVVKLAEVDKLRLRVPVPESLTGAIHEGADATVLVQATNEHFTGKVCRFTNSLDRSTRTMQVEVDVPNRQYHLSPGMYANVELQLQKHPNALTVSIQALNRSDGKVSVLIVNSQNRIEERQIVTGLEEPDRVEVLSGLAEGDHVIIGNLGTFREGDRVDPHVSAFMSSQPAETDEGGK